MSSLRDDADKAIKEAGNALCFHGARLGMVTKAANKHKEEFTDKNGQPAFRYLRDSTTVTKQMLNKPPASITAVGTGILTYQAEGTPPVELASSSTQQHVLPSDEKAVAKRKEASKRKAADKECTDTLVQTLTSCATPPPVDAATRMAALRARLAL